jgi:outer membrane protein OmpA-like peptidoglycan-associated protein
MDNNQPGYTQPQPSVEPPVQPQMQPQPEPTPTPSPYPTSSPQLAPKKSKKGLIIGLSIGGAVVLVGVILAVLVAIAMPSLESIARADKFMQHMTAGDVAGAMVDAGNDESSRAFIAQASEKVKGATYKLADKQYNAKGQSYYLYTLSGVDQKYARVATAVANGKRVVSSFVYSTTQLALVPGVASTTQPEAQTNSPAATGQCFAPSDYNVAFGYNNTLSFSEEVPYTTNVHFQPDSLEYTDTASGQGADQVAQIVTSNPGKGYKISLQGSVATTNAADKDFANSRANKVKAALVAKGVAASNITILDPSNVADMGGDNNNATLKEMARNVVIKFAPACSTNGSAK